MWRISWAFVIRWTCAAVITVCVFYAAFIFGPALETKFFPVVTNFKIIKETVSDDRVEISVEFEKKRDCAYLGTAWYRGHRTKIFEQVRFATQPVSGRVSPSWPVGKQSSGPWTVFLSKEDLASNSFAEFYHQCHLLWITRTEFYPAP